MRYLGQLGVAALAASRADTDAQARADRPIDGVSAGPWLPSEEQAAAWRTWAMAGAAGIGPAGAAGAEPAGAAVAEPADAGTKAETGQLAAGRPLRRLRTLAVAMPGSGPPFIHVEPRGADGSGPADVSSQIDIRPDGTIIE